VLRIFENGAKSKSTFAFIVVHGRLAIENCSTTGAFGVGTTCPSGGAKPVRFHRCAACCRARRWPAPTGVQNQTSSARPLDRVPPPPPVLARQETKATPCTTERTIFCNCNGNNLDQCRRAEESQPRHADQNPRGYATAQLAATTLSLSRSGQPMRTDAGDNRVDVRNQDFRQAEMAAIVFVRPLAISLPVQVR
jgi:hypothetical protein